MSPVDRVPAPLWARDIVSDLKSASSTFSSWDSCMSKAYCKWPVIAAIIVGALILLSIIACVVNCLCCGIQCCTGCCGCCSMCCPSPRNRQRKAQYSDDPYPPPEMPGAMPPSMPVNTPYQPLQQPPVYRGAEVARFDAPTSPVGSKFHDDALPAMPSWDNAVTKRVEDTGPHVETVELEAMDHVSREPRRMPSAPRMNPGGMGGAGYSGPPPVRSNTPGQYPARTGTSGQYPARTGIPSQYPDRTGTPGHHLDRTGTPGHYAEPHNYNAQSSYGYDTQNTYGYNHNGPRSPPPVSPYDEQPYNHDFPHEDRYMSPAPTYTTQPAFAAAEHSQPHYMPSETPLPPYMPMDRTRSPGPTLSSAMNAPRPMPYRQPSPAIGQYTAYPGVSPVTPTSPPPFAAAPAPHEASDPGRPPSLLQSGRRPVPNSYRDV
ncbi:uncharacterized protein BO97DRAFT_3035 [Aspergillus homomorphus CBS 101889]|uniref:Fibroin-3 related protein n=1 Tax=Aspergillus homomorphus (strain CBS 101889) TaxID=1450537 RepID=A0A395IDN4_ASPHC|nr:hypothetical protein BO97DRAFT_3035 [Aspergillus homomorphus CBS 101889]RAL17258.1 hypothetical protein BO97DRAFT_3035 [Aspergillus homomorphus CBS 101889]